MSFFKKIFENKNKKVNYLEEQKKEDMLEALEMQESKEIQNIEIQDEVFVKQPTDLSEKWVDHEKISTVEQNLVEAPTQDVEEVSTDVEKVSTDVQNDPILTKKKGFFAKLAEGLGKTRTNIIQGVEQVLKSFTKIDDALFDELEEVLIMADVGVETTMKIMESIKRQIKLKKITEVSMIKELLIEEINRILTEDHEPLAMTNTPMIILVIGVNGAGKTTTIGKLAHNFKQDKKKVLLAAGDTFRAAAIDQLEVWSHRASVDMIRHQENSDPAAVIFDAIQSAKAKKIDMLICDTAGRLHNKKNLMEELRKIFKVIEREYPEAHKEVLLVLDATTGQNALQQAKTFKEVAEISGIVLTKLDGTAKGGIVIAIKSELHIPVKFIGVGEGIDDLQPFNPQDFAKALFTDI